MSTLPRSLAAANRGDLPLGRTLALGTLWVLWQAVRLSVLAFLIILEPLVALVLSATAFVGIAAACVLRLSGDLPHFPFWGMVACSVGSVLLLMAYHAVVKLLAQ